VDLGAQALVIPLGWHPSIWMASMSAKPTQFSFPLCHSFPAVCINIAASYLLNVQFVISLPTRVVFYTCTKVLTSWTVSPKLSLHAFSESV